MGRWFIIIVFVLAMCLNPVAGKGLGPGQDLYSEKPGSCYFVLATDVSGSMSRADPLVRDPEGKLQAIRDDAQLTFLQLLENLYTRHYVGICKFTDKITYGLPGGKSKNVDPKKSLLNWQDTGLDWRTLRKEISTIKTGGGGGTRIEHAMQWAERRISLAREWHKDEGRGVMVILTDGDPDSALGELSPRGGPVLQTAGKLASENIRVYPIIINQASYHPGRISARLDVKHQSAERLMELVAAKTGGEAYRITPTFGLLQILLEILNISLGFDMPAPTPVDEPEESFLVSKHHRTAILIGPALESIQIDALGGRSGAKSYSLLMEDGPDDVSGITRKVIPLARWTIAILRRPENADRLENFWGGKWRPIVKGSAAPYRGRVYLITDFLLQMAIEPTLPCWTHELVQVKARLVERPQELGEHGVDVPPLKGEDLSLQFTVSHDGERPFEIPSGRWDQGGRTHVSSPFRLGKAGQYNLTCACADRVADVKVPLGRFSRSFGVEQCPISLSLIKHSTGETVLEIAGGRETVGGGCTGGEEVHAEFKIIEQKVRAEKLTGALHLDNVTPEEWSFKQDGPGRIATGPFTLPEKDIHLVGHAEVSVRTATAVRQVYYPDPSFDFIYFRIPPRLEREFSDSRRALWVGELHRQKLTVSISPVFDDRLESVVRSLPSDLAEAEIRVFDSFGEVSKVIPVRCDRESEPLSRATDGKGKTIWADYGLESDVPIPPGNYCKIDIGTVMAGLRQEEKEKGRYTIVDPVEEGIFLWQLSQEPAEDFREGVADVIYRGESIRFGAKWRPDQHVSRVSFELYAAGSDRRLGGIKVGLPVVGGGNGAHITQKLDKLRPDQTYQLFVHVRLRPSGVESETDILLDGGSFYVDPSKVRLLELKELVVGDKAGEDITCYTFEEVELPLRVSFAGYVTGSTRHNQLIERFKTSCMIRVTSAGGDREDISSDDIRWRRPRSDEGSRGIYRLEGVAAYAPKRVGRALVEFSGEVEARDASGTLRSVHAAHAGLLVGKPRVTVKVNEIESGGENLLFDSQKWASGEPVDSVTKSFATKLRVLVELDTGVFVTQGKPCKIQVNIGFAGKAQEMVAGRGELTRDEPGLDVSSTTLEGGQYYVRVFTPSLEPDHPKVRLVTPTLLSVDDSDVRPVIPLDGFLTECLRQLPFCYHVRIESDWPFHPASLEFQFQLPGMQDDWLTGRAYISSEDPNYLICKNPEFLPRLKGITSGKARFRLRCMGLEPFTWETDSPVRVVEPRLQGALFTNERNGRWRPSNELVQPLEAPVSLGIRPKFRDAPELEGWWLIEEIKVCICRNPGVELEAGKPASPAVLKEIMELEAAGQAGKGNDVQVLPFEEHEALLGKESIDQAAGASRFWGLPSFGGQDMYAIMIKATYKAKCTVSSGEPSGKRGGSRLVTEWSEPYKVLVEHSWSIPGVYWLIAVLLAVVAFVVCVQVLKLCVPGPEDLRLTVQLEGEFATISPSGDFGVFARIQQTQLTEELETYREYVGSRLTILGGALASLISAASHGFVVSLFSGFASKLLTYLPVALKVLLGRLFLPRRRAWITVRPVADGATNIQPGFICIWTGLVKQNGQLWSSETRSSEEPPPPDLDLPPKRIPINLRFRIDGGDKHNSVTLLVTRSKQTDTAGE